MHTSLLMRQRKSDTGEYANRARHRWRQWVLGLLLILLVGFIGCLFWVDTPRSTRAGLMLGGTLVGMLALAAYVCRK